MSLSNREDKFKGSDSGVSWPQILEKGFVWLARILAFAVLATLIWMVVIVTLEAWPAIAKYGLGFLTSSGWAPNREEYGALPHIYGTLVSSLIALILAVPVGLGVAIFLSEDYLPPNIQQGISFLVELLAAIPSVVYGLWGIFVVIPLLRPIGVNGPCLLASSVVLAIMILPTIAVLARDALLNVPDILRQGAYGLGATRWETILRVLLPAAFSGIVGAIMLALGRALGETMAVTMLIGNNPKISFSLFAPASSIAGLLANQFAEADGMQVYALMYAALILFALTLVVNMLAEVLIRRVQRI
ncbi:MULTISPECIES: phosphate ABC transporter permease subunit PstC [Planktothricoides]|uniref:Phosphate transport system permease protein n=2 Tax=Planktothricoides raciborskii TaxID=132608 RepID=A0AAU8JEC7_9CYAN|nr:MULTISPECIES: phosphate ABC transporter permease subunit PstC [Planktothricoides]KOR35431.1 phosphate ABC transporter permease [Planktothricoides sp. SR001]MBD2545916.1 phosphate ABC transporter permease subunit PstC [Planktothricoides raciborskii FACHB-1370]MBD2584033.1 phosphate ABC transporter permease subunit PstC [Planktothricoides raciborskii FACHB-1261]